MATTSGLCKLRVRAPATSFELAVPVDIPLIDLMPTILGHAGHELAEEGVDHDGWILQRLGDPPLDQESTVDVLDLRDGETLHLRPRREQLPAVHFDDIIDGLSTEARARPDSWSAQATRWTMLGGVLAAVALGFFLLVTAPAGWPTLLSAGVAAFFLLVCAATAARALGDGAAALALALAAVPFVGLAGSLVPHGPEGPVLTGARLLAACVAGAGAAALGMAAVAGSAAVFVSVATFALLCATGGLVLMLGGESASASATIIAVIAVLLGAFVPRIAFRLSGLRLPGLPTTARELQEELDPHPGDEVVGKGLIADAFVTALFAAIGTACLVTLEFVVRDRSWQAVTFAAVLSVLLLVHGRALGSVWQRLSVIVPGVYGVLRLLLASQSDSHSPLPMVAGVFALAALVLVARWTLPGRRMLPQWGRLADLAETLAAIALLPLALWLIGVFGFVRGFGG
ncbi:type VII secretion integral membrane protein EccD [Amycolatopsis thailandensis]|uniref:Type VII secretion integral membrane protein EccD n=1 Tax=Amycolatopsis thailandensis TaxID=589330 RepID=A0A229RPS5_9PSEU|nr:type VII secretion integral membrane protein EccD [Amycolatopsis thailandensis]OXM48479.1 type VII secretion integral membrane protein EccD [Amycolatopsis thailandensis]